MEITYDGLASPTNKVTFTGIPNILTVSSGFIQGSKAKLVIKVYSLKDIDPSKEYKITINGITITSTNKINTGSKLFYITNLDSDNNRIAVASSIVRALRNTKLINYEVYQEVNTGVLVSSIVVLAIEVGELYSITLDTDLKDAVSYSYQQGSTTDEFINSRICVDVYSLDDYITTLDKNYYKDKIDFNLSLILTSISRYDYPTPYKLVVYQDKGNLIKSLGVIDNMYSSIGYMVNQGDKLLDLGANSFALNVKRGFQEGVYNKEVLYTFNSSIPLSVYSDLNTVVVEIDYLDASKELFSLASASIPVYNNYGYSDIELDSALFNRSSYIDIKIPEVGTIRYNVIKPVDATSRCLRVYYHNSYGGVSFFDFTGEITENHKTDNDTYTKNIYDYYTDTSLEQTKVYGKKNSITVTMKSHLMERSAVWQFNDLMGSYDVWTIVNGVQYKIIVTDCRVDETETGVWEATVTYTYSLI